MLTENEGGVMEEEHTIFCEECGKGPLEVGEYFICSMCCGTFCMDELDTEYDEMFCNVCGTEDEWL